MQEENRMEEIMTVSRCSSVPERAPECFRTRCKQHKPSDPGTLGLGAPAALMGRLRLPGQEGLLEMILAGGFKLYLGKFCVSYV